MDPKDLTPQGTEQPQPEAIEIPQEPNEPAPEPAAEPEPQPEPAPQPQEPDWKTKATEQGRENIILAHKLEQEEKARRELTNEPTESDLQAAFPDWEMMSPTEQALAKRTLASERTAKALLLKENAREQIERWDNDLEFAIAKNPSLLGKEQAFKDFARKPTRRGVDVDVLVKAFLYDAAPPSPSPVPAPRQPGLEPGTGGPKTPVKPKLLTAPELKQLRETDDKAYREYIATHDVSLMLEE